MSLKWRNLKEVKCPQCSETLKHETTQQYYSCGCGFHITHKRFNELVEEMYNPKKPVGEGDNQADLNNLGINSLRTGR